MNVTIELIKEFGIKKAEKELKKWEEIDELLVSKSIIKAEKEKIEQFNRDVEILEYFYVSLNIK